jgi:dipeptidyl aminopeptidase/acylaminoacyl peptidase
MIRKALLLSWLLFAGLILAAQQPIVTSDLLKLSTAGQLTISPDGRQVAYVLTQRAAREKDEYYYTRNIYLAPMDGSRPPRPLTHGDRNDGQPAWSPDGRHLAFTRTHEGKSQIWILPLEGGEAYPLTRAKHGAAQPRWSPSGDAILFASPMPRHALEGAPAWDSERPGRAHGDEPEWSLLSDEEKKALPASPDGDLNAVRAWLARNSRNNNPRVINRLQFQGELDLQPEETFQQLFIQPFPKGEARRVTHSFQSFGGATWSPDGRRILCVAGRPDTHPDYQSRENALWIMDADGGGSREWLRQPDCSFSQPRFSPRGERVAFSANCGEGFIARQSNIALADADGANYQLLTADFDRDVNDFEWTADGQALYFTASTEGDIPLFRISARGGQAVRLFGEQQGVMDFAARGDRLAYALTETANPWEVYARENPGAPPRRLTDLHGDWLKDKRIGALNMHWVERPDGFRVQYWVMEPAGRKDGLRYPTILNIHGGPTAMWGPSAFSMWHEFQLQTSWGYGLVFCNPRGSGGYGDAFKKANINDWGSGPAGDILAALEDAQRRYDWIDGDQLFATGGSYAGYMVAWLVATDQRFKAANCQRGVYELSTFLGEGNAWRLVPGYFGGYPWDAEVKARLDANSPLSFVDSIRTPLLIMHSDQDLRTGVIQSEMLYKSLKILERPAEYIRYPKEGHELSRSGDPLRMMDRLIRIIEFFERYASHPEPPPAVMGR